MQLFLSSLPSLAQVSSHCFRKLCMIRLFKSRWLAMTYQIILAVCSASDSVSDVIAFSPAQERSTYKMPFDLHYEENLPGTEALLMILVWNDMAKPRDRNWLCKHQLLSSYNVVSWVCHLTGLFAITASCLAGRRTFLWWRQTWTLSLLSAQDLYLCRCCGTMVPYGGNNKHNALSGVNDLFAFCPLTFSNRIAREIGNWLRP